VRVAFVGRLGLRELAADHANTLYELDEHQRQHASRADLAVFYALPLAAWGTAWALSMRLRGVAEILAGVAILTGLLFGLLVHVFSVGLRISEDGRWSSSSKVTILVDELRANVAYACGVGLVLTVLLVIAAALGASDSSPIVVSPSTGHVQVADTHSGLTPWLSGLVAALFLHLVLTLFMVLKRVRTAYKLLAK
jgi:hypothetical protein